MAGRNHRQRRGLVALVAVGGASLALVGQGTAAGAQARTPDHGIAFTVYAAPTGSADSAAEPSLGFDERSGAILFQADTQTYRVANFDDQGRSEWLDVTPTLPGILTLDPILEADPVTGRAFVSSLTGACSLMAYTDDGGESWTDVPLGCAPGAAFDHQAVGQGAFVAGGVLQATGSYPRAVYYCAHDGLVASCGTSLDGGQTFLPAVPAYSQPTCDSSFGRLASAPDGTAYLPPMSCGHAADVLSGTSQGLAISRDNGLTWTLRVIPGTTAGDTGDPSVYVARDGTVYDAYGGADGRPYVMRSSDRGSTFSLPVALGVEQGVAATRFVSTIAGDGDRAAVAFLGSTASGDANAASYPGTWYLYVAFTYDRGSTWSTVNATPGQPVQVGGICATGLLCPDETRNLLDFLDVDLDSAGRIVVAFADGCTSMTCTTEVREAHGTLLRQSAGRGLLAAREARLAGRLH